ncbi:hypothetical protein AJ78_06852 [Emergomyces pasteurianus Ep9510]|uniref:SWI/SNF family DNA-dependent ATPase Ris1 n=1 Tax=Emergomyces pasteurianus Ep9510 TaxID=1447872 RepID=A0A1J9P929_9EURO|nr:hypothetical protein AJ78_06852 [Emergomyces pasteurianus Ep9510]
MEPNALLKSTSTDDIEPEHISQVFNGNAATTMDPGDGEDQDRYPCFDEDEIDNDLQRSLTASTDPRSTVSSDPGLVAIQRRLIDIEDDSTHLKSSGPGSSAASDKLLQTSFQDQDTRELGALSNEDTHPPADSDDSDFPTIVANSNRDALSNPLTETLSPDPTRESMSSRKRLRTISDASLPASNVFSSSKSRKTTPSPLDNGGPSAGLNDLALRQLFALPGSDDFEELEREQLEAENWLKQKKEQERLDEEFARSLQQHWNEESYSTSSSSSIQNRSKQTLIPSFHTSFPAPGAVNSLTGKNPAAKPVYNKTGSSFIQNGKSGNAPKFSDGYIEISSDSELEQTYTPANYSSSSHSTLWSRDQGQAAASARGLSSNAHTSPSSFSTSYRGNNSIMPQVGDVRHPIQPGNSMSLSNPYMFGAKPDAMSIPNSSSSRNNSYHSRYQPSDPLFNGHSSSYEPDYVRHSVFNSLISKATSELESHGMSSRHLGSAIYDQITPETTKEELQQLLENIRPDQELDCNREGTPEALKFTLMEHQKLGLAWMKSMEEGSNRGGILADDMGLGKTVQAIALMVSRPSRDPERKTTLIIAPVALIQQWKREIERMLKPKHQLTVFILHNERGVKFSNLKKYDVVLTTFGTLASELKRKIDVDKMRTENQHTYQNLRPEDVFMLPLLGERSKWYRVIVDEAQCIKNKDTKSAQACYLLNSTYRWCMSGTPMMNNVSELYSLIKFLRIRPYNAIEKFNHAFATPLKSSSANRQNIALQKLQALLKAILLRRTKTSKIDGKRILQLPPRTTEKRHAVFSEDEKALYDALESKTQLQFNKYLRAGTIGRNYSNVLVLLLRLRQACCHPHLMTDFGVEATAETAKVDLIENAKRLEPEVVSRLKENEALECPVCIDAVENAVIFFPCGHSTCAECFTRISDPSRGLVQGNDGSVSIKCPHCRALIDPKKITDYFSFKKVFCSDPSEANVEENATDPGADLDCKDGDAGKGKDKAIEKPQQSLLQLKKAATKSVEAKREYLRYLTENWVTSAKIEKTMELLYDIQSRIPEGDDKPEKTIIFSQFTSLLDLLQVPITREGWCYRRYDGTMQPNQRNEAVLEFSDSKDCTIMLVSLKAGNSGLNLVAASQVIILDPFWNPYIEEQAIDRAHRIGQMRPVMVHRILVENTVEDRILALQDKKRDLIEGALDEKASQTIGRLNTRELAFLFVSIILFFPPFFRFILHFSFNSDTNGPFLLTIILIS